MKKYNKLLHGCLVVAMFLLGSCATKVWEGVPNPMGMLGKDADMYLYLPVREHTTLLNAMLKGTENEKDFKQIIQRTDVMYASFFGKVDETRLCAMGSFPNTLTDVLFQSSKGWKRGSFKGLKFYTSDYLDISIPSPKIACVLLGGKNRLDMPSYLGLLDMPEEPQDLPERFTDVLQGKTDTNTIAVFIKNSQYFMQRMVSIQGLDLPFGEVELFLHKQAERQYTYSLFLKTENRFAAFAMRLLLSKAMQSDVLVDGNELRIQDAPIEFDQLVTLMRSMSFQ